MKQILTTTIGKQNGIDIMNAYMQWHYGSVEPNPTYPFQNWADTGNNLWKQRNESDDGWIVRGVLDAAQFGLTPIDGWISGFTAVYVSSNEIKIEGLDVTDRIQQGTKIRYKQGGDYLYLECTNISFSTDTTITTKGNALADAAITDFYYSNLINPFGWPTNPVDELKTKIEILETGIVNVKTFGAVGDNAPGTIIGTNDTTAIRDAITYAASIATASFKPTLYFPPCPGYRITDTITVPINVNVVMDAPMIYTADDYKTALEIGDITHAGDNNFIGLFKLNVERHAVTSNWAHSESIGINLINTVNAKIEIVRIKNFAVGLQCTGDNSGFVHNNIFLQDLCNNRRQIKIYSMNSGWVNQNQFFGGRFRNTSGIGTGVGRYGVEFTGDVLYHNNSNTFYSPSFELNATESGEGSALPVLVTYGIRNSFYNCRNEGNTEKFAVINNSSDYNIFTTVFGACVIDQNGTGTHNVGITQAKMIAGLKGWD